MNAGGSSPGARIAVGGAHAHRRSARRMACVVVRQALPAEARRRGPPFWLLLPRRGRASAAGCSPASRSARWRSAGQPTRPIGSSTCNALLPLGDRFFVAGAAAHRTRAQTILDQRALARCRKAGRCAARRNEQRAGRLRDRAPPKVGPAVDGAFGARRRVPGAARGGHRSWVSSPAELYIPPRNEGVRAERIAATATILLARRRLALGACGSQGIGHRQSRGPSYRGAVACFRDHCSGLATRCRSSARQGGSADEPSKKPRAARKRPTETFKHSLSQGERRTGFFYAIRNGGFLRRDSCRRTSCSATTPSRSPSSSPSTRAVQAQGRRPQKRRSPLVRRNRTPAGLRGVPRTSSESGRDPEGLLERRGSRAPRPSRWRPHIAEGGGRPNEQ